MTIQNPASSIKGYIFWLIAIILGASGLAMAYLYWQSDSFLAIENEIIYYHLETSQACIQTKEKIRIALHHDTLVRLSQHEPTTKLHHDDYLSVIEEEFKEILQIQQHFQSVAPRHPSILFVLNKAKQQMSQLEQTWGNTNHYGTLSSSVRTNLIALAHTLERLQRLHIIDRKEMLADFFSKRKDKNINFLSVILILILSGSYFIYRALALITSMLIQQEETELRFRSVTRSIVDGIIATDEEGNIIFWNEGAQLIFGYTEEEILGQPVTILMPEQFRQAHNQGLEKVRTTGVMNLSGQVVEMSGLRKEGKVFPLEVSLASWVVGGKRYFSSVIRDITERWHLNQEKARQELALQQAKESAESANKAKSDFLSNMSHEIRTPMNGVLGMAELLLDMPLSKEARGHVTAIQNSGKSLLGIINDILDLSKVEAGKIELEEIDFHLPDLLESLADFFTLSAMDRKITFHKTCSQRLPSVVVGDPVRLQQVLTNLLSNAIKFTETGRVSLSVYPTVQEGRALQIVFQVKDTGIGIKPEQFAKLFKSFEQCDNSITRKFGGTGLGLAITHRLVTLMRGHIEVESKHKQGSTFKVTLPFTRGNEQALAQNAEHKPTQNGGLTFLGASILIAEDDPTNRAVLNGLLKPFNLRLDFAKNGRHALKKLATTHYDLVFMDCQMPELDGFAACRAFRAMEAQKGTYTPVVALTAHALKGDQERCMAAGMDDYLTKPINRQRLSAALTRWITSQKPVQTEQNKHANPENKRTNSSLEQKTLNILREDLEEDDFIHIIKVYLDNLPSKVVAIRAAIEAQDPERLAHTAHTMKSSSRQLGALTLGDLCETLERAANQPTPVHPGAEQLAQLEKEVANVEEELRKITCN